jgi:phosphoinositide-3-kinase, regulatory subunit 4
MIELDSTARPTFDTLLHTSRGSVFPESFYSFLHNYVSSLNDLPHNTPFATASPPTASIISAQTSVAPSVSGSNIRPGSSLAHNASNVTATGNTTENFPSDSDHRLEKLWADYESVEPYLGLDTMEETVMDVKLEYAMNTTGVSKPFQVRFLYERKYVMFLIDSQDILPVELYIPNRDSKLQSTVHKRPRAASEGQHNF